MSILLPPTIAGYAKGAGFTGNDVAVAVAVAMAESGGNTDAVGDNGTSIGIWQIHVTAHPEFASVNLKDPAVNAAAAYKIKTAKGNWSDWSTYNSLRYYAFLPAAEAVAAAATPLGGVGPALLGQAAQSGLDAATSTASQTAQGLAAVRGFLQDLQDPAIWIRVAKVALGGLAVIVGVQLVASRALAPAVQSVAGPATSIAKKVAK